MEKTYVTTEQFAERLHYDSRYINNALKDVVFIEGVHYIRPFGRRRILYIWEKIEEDMVKPSKEQDFAVPMASGGVFNG